MRARWSQAAIDAHERGQSDEALRLVGWPSTPIPRISACSCSCRNSSAKPAIPRKPSGSRALPSPRRRAIRRRLYVLGGALGAAGDSAAAEDALRKSLELDPGFEVAGVDLAGLLLQAARPLDAEAVLRPLLASHPDSAELHATLGLALRLRGKTREALGHFESALRARPDELGHLNNHALCLRDLDRLDEAAAELQRALASSGGDASTVVNLANVLRELGRAGECLDALEALVSAAPDNAEARTTLGKMLADAGATAWASQEFDAALTAMPGSPDVTLARGMHRLALGDFAGGWADYAARLRTAEWPQRALPFPEWDGETFAGKSVLVYAEQGLGDEIMFASCFAELIAEARRCVIECDPRLERLFARSFPAAAVFAGRLRRKHPWLEQAGEIDVQVPAGSLPLRYRTAAEQFPSHRGYLRADPQLVARYRDRLAALGGRVRVGIAWRGGVAKTRAAVRTIPAAAWAPLVAREDLCLISLQHGPVDDDLAALGGLVPGRSVHHWPEVQRDIEHLAALVCALDISVSACNATVHLAGALGRPVLALVPSAPEWRYGREGEGMVWYPSVRLLRQRWRRNGTR